MHDLKEQLARHEAELERLQAKFDVACQLGDCFGPEIATLERALDYQQHTVDVLRECVERPLVF